jgi:exodeoxyribonuclease VII large subunit
VRAPTPTGAAEMAVPVRAELEAQLSGLAARLSGSVSRQMDNRRQGVRALVRALPSLDQLLALPRRRFDEAASGLGRGLEMTTLNKRRAFERSASGLRPETLLNGLKQHRQRITERMHRAETLVERRLLQGKGRIDAFDSALRSLPARLLGQVERQKERVVTGARRADTAVLHRMAQNRAGLAAHDRILQSLSYKNVLKRGYAVIRDEENRPLTRAAAVASGAVVSMEFADGRVSAITTGEGAPSPDNPVVPKKKPAKPASSDPGNQGSLF